MTDYFVFMQERKLNEFKQTIEEKYLRMDIDGDILEIVLYADDTYLTVDTDWIYRGYWTTYPLDINSVS